MKAGLGFLFIVCASSAFAQTIRPGPPIFIREVLSKHIDPNPWAGIEGSPIVTDRWLLARIKTEGRAELIDSLPIKINVFSNGVHFINETGEEMQIALRIEQITIIDKSSVLNNAVFLSNFSQEKGFFLVIADAGKLKLLKKLRIYIWEVQPVGMEVQRKFEIQDDLYLSYDNLLYKPSKSCTAITDAFGNNEKVLNYISENNLHCNKEEDMKKVVAFYASLK
jgi:hypothetical protein